MTPADPGHPQPQPQDMVVEGPLVVLRVGRLVQIVRGFYTGAVGVLTEIAAHPRLGESYPRVRVAWPHEGTFRDATPLAVDVAPVPEQDLDHHYGEIYERTRSRWATPWQHLPRHHRDVFITTVADQATADALERPAWDGRVELFTRPVSTGLLSSDRRVEVLARLGEQIYSLACIDPTTLTPAELRQLVDELLAELRAHVVPGHSPLPSTTETTVADDQHHYSEQRVRGCCPMGCGRTLTLTSTGNVQCVDPRCPDPDAVAELLADQETEHIVQFGPAGFTVRHPLRERLRDGLMRCQLHTYITTQPTPPAEPGRYRVVPDGTGWTFLPLHSRGASA